MFFLRTDGMNSNRPRLINDEINKQQELKTINYTGSKKITRWNFW